MPFMLSSPLKFQGSGLYLFGKPVYINIIAWFYDLDVVLSLTFFPSKNMWQNEVRLDFCTVQMCILYLKLVIFLLGLAVNLCLRTRLCMCVCVCLAWLIWWVACSFVWLELVSHRSFMPKLLTGNGQKGWPYVQRLLVDLFQFMEPFLRNAELGEPVCLVNLMV